MEIFAGEATEVAPGGEVGQVAAPAAPAASPGDAVGFGKPGDSETPENLEQTVDFAMKIMDFPMKTMDFSMKIMKYEAFLVFFLLYPSIDYH